MALVRCVANDVTNAEGWWASGRGILRQRESYNGYGTGAKHVHDLPGARPRIGCRSCAGFASAGQRNVVLMAQVPESQDAIADLAGEIGKQAIAIPWQRGPVSAEMLCGVETALGAFGSVDVADQQRRPGSSRSRHLWPIGPDGVVSVIRYHLKGVYTGCASCACGDEDTLGVGQS